MKKWENLKTHWYSKHPLYNVWESIKRKCNNPNQWIYKYYWWRWITYEERRENFMPFYIDNIELYKEWLTIDRIDNNWNYSKENCRWITQKNQARNKNNNRVFTINWETHCFSEWCEILWINYSTARSRYYTYWWTIEQSLEVDKEDCASCSG